MKATKQCRNWQIIARSLDFSDDSLTLPRASGCLCSLPIVTTGFIDASWANRAVSAWMVGHHWADFIADLFDLNQALVLSAVKQAAAYDEKASEICWWVSWYLITSGDATNSKRAEQIPFTYLSNRSFSSSQNATPEQVTSPDISWHFLSVKRLMNIIGRFVFRGRCEHSWL